MKTAIAVPYKRGSAARVTFGAWQLVSVESASPLPEMLSGLDYGSALSLHREIIVDVGGLRSDCGLTPAVPLVAAASWSSPGTSLRRSLCKTDILDNEEMCLVALSGEISGGDIAGMLHIDTTIVVARSNDQAGPLAARQAGSVLLHDRQTIQLDSSASFFPVEIVDFNTGHWANPDAGWRLSWNSFALEQPFLGSVRLFINASHSRVAHAVSGESPTGDCIVVRSAIYFDVARTLVLGALGSDEFIERDGDYGDGSCGKVIYALIQMLFPGDALGGLASAASERADHFNTDLQGRLRLFWG